MSTMLVEGMSVARDIATFLGALGTLLVFYDRFGPFVREQFRKLSAVRRDQTHDTRIRVIERHDRQVRYVGYAVATVFCFGVYISWSAPATIIASVLWFAAVGSLSQTVDYRTSTFIFEFAIASAWFGFVLGDIGGMLLFVVESFIARPNAFVVGLVFAILAIAFAFAAEAWF